MLLSILNMDVSDPRWEDETRRGDSSIPDFPSGSLKKPNDALRGWWRVETIFECEGVG